MPRPTARGFPRVRYKPFLCSKNLHPVLLQRRDIKHTEGGGEKYLAREFGTVQPLVFGHFGELNERFEGLLDSTARCVANLHHREHGWKSAKAGYPRAKAGVMRRVSMAVLKATARHTLHGLEIITPQAMHTHTARRAKSEATSTAGTRGPLDAPATTSAHPN